MNFSQDSRFARELKKLGRKYKNLAQDLEIFQRVHGLVYSPEVGDSLRRNLFASKKASRLHGSWSSRQMIVKARLDSRDLDNKTIRVVYQLDLDQLEITLIEIYAKNQKTTEDKKRWLEYI